MADLLIKNAKYIITMDNDRRIKKNGYLAIEGKGSVSTSKCACFVQNRYGFFHLMDVWFRGLSFLLHRSPRIAVEILL